MTLAQAYTALSDILDREKHDPDCAWRCLVPRCRADHWCGACDMSSDVSEMPAYAAPVARYAPPTKGKKA